MPDYSAITDRSNTFNTAGLSDEVHALLGYMMKMKAAGQDAVVTCTTDHARLSASGNVSRHRQAGTNGEGLAIDCRMRTRGLDIHRAVFDAFVPVEKQLHELIYAGAPYNIKAGKRVTPYAVSGHRDHVHVAVNRGTFLRWPTPAPTPAQEARMARVPNPAGFCVTASGNLIITSTDGAIYAYNRTGGTDNAGYIDAYNRHPELGGANRACIGVYADGDDYTQVFDDGARYAWRR